MIASNEGKIRGAKVLPDKTRNIIDRSVNRLYPMKTNFQFVLKGDKQGSDRKDEANNRPKPNFESSMPLASTKEGAVLNISDTH